MFTTPKSISKAVALTHAGLVDALSLSGQSTAAPAKKPPGELVKKTLEDLNGLLTQQDTLHSEMARNLREAAGNLTEATTKREAMVEKLEKQKTVVGQLGDQLMEFAEIREAMRTIR